MLSHILMTVMCMQLLLFCTCTCSGLPHNVVHSSSIFYLSAQRVNILLDWYGYHNYINMAVTTVGGTKITNTQQQSQGQSQR